MTGMAIRNPRAGAVTERGHSWETDETQIKPNLVHTGFLVLTNTLIIWDANKSN